LWLTSLRAYRDVVDVRDVADAVVAVAQAPAAVVAGGIVNIGSGEAVPMRWLVDLMISLCGFPVRIVEIGRPRVAFGWALAARIDCWAGHHIVLWRSHCVTFSRLRRRHVANLAASCQSDCIAPFRAYR
jgi:nucleoside-diphosphate-sugar epimerase